MTRKEGNCWIDGRGEKVPVRYVPEEDKVRESIVDEVFKLVYKLNELLSSGKEEIDEKVGNYLDSVKEQYEKKSRKGKEWKGNARITDFGGERVVELSISDMIDHDERLQIAEKKIRNCINRWKDGSKPQMIKFVDKAFKTDSNGRVDKRELKKFKSFGFKDKEWLEAMDIIDESEKVVGQKKYYNFYVKDDKGEMKPVHLTFAKL